MGLTELLSEANTALGDATGTRTGLYAALDAADFDVKFS